MVAYYTVRGSENLKQLRNDRISTFFKQCFSEFSTIFHITFQNLGLIDTKLRERDIETDLPNLNTWVR